MTRAASTECLLPLPATCLRRRTKWRGRQAKEWGEGRSCKHCTKTTSTCSRHPSPRCAGRVRSELLRALRPRTHPQPLPGGEQDRLASFPPGRGATPAGEFPSWEGSGVGWLPEGSWAGYSRRGGVHPTVSSVPTLDSPDASGILPETCYFLRQPPSSSKITIATRWRAGRPTIWPRSGNL